MSKLRDPQAVARATGSDPVAVAAALPHIIKALEEQKILDQFTVIAALATVAVECHFRPVEEAYWLKPGPRAAYLARYDHRSDLGNSQDGDGLKYCGRGFIQLTGKHNYQVYGDALGIDLVNHPDKALQSETAAKVLALYFVFRHIPDKARAQNWEAVRRAVNGGLNGFEKFKAYVVKLLQLYEASKNE